MPLDKFGSEHPRLQGNINKSPTPPTYPSPTGRSVITRVVRDQSLERAQNVRALDSIAKRNWAFMFIGRNAYSHPQGAPSGCSIIVVNGRRPFGMPDTRHYGKPAEKF